jgi:MFS-type transporter involved in bile tolerance (Atg22 family)
MATDALAALLFGRLYDQVGMWPLVAVSAAVPLFVPLIFSADFTTVAVGMLLYGVGFGAQESVMRALVADMTPHCRRGYAFGCYNAAFGVSWFLGSVAMGVLYDISLPAMMAMSMLLQFASIPLLIVVMRGRSREGRDHERSANGMVACAPAAPEPPASTGPVVTAASALELPQAVILEPFEHTISVPPEVVITESPDGER